MVLLCPFCAVWAVTVLGAETWKAPGGGRVELVSGRCEACRSLILTDPSRLAIEMVKDKLAGTRDAMRAVSGA